MSSKKGAKKKKRNEDDEMDIDEDDERVLFFIPAASINMEVLVWYLRQFLGHDSDAEPGVHPTNRDVNGYLIKSRLSLNAVMVADLKTDSEDWKEEKRKKRTRKAYSESDTAAYRLEKGASGRPTIPKKTQELAAARRGEPAQPVQGNTIQAPVARHQGQQDMTMQSGSYPAEFYQPEANRRHEATYPGQQPPFSFASPTFGQPRPTPAINVNLNMAAYQQNDHARHQNPQQPNPLPSTEGRGSYYSSPAPPYEDSDSKQDNRPIPPSQPSTTGTQGFSSTYATAGSRHDKPQARR